MPDEAVKVPNWETDLVHLPMHGDLYCGSDDPDALVVLPTSPYHRVSCRDCLAAFEKRMGRPWPRPASTLRRASDA